MAAELERVKQSAVELICNLFRFTRWPFNAAVLVALSLAMTFASTDAMAAVHGTTSWAILRCQLKNTPKPTFQGTYAKDPEQFYSDFFTEAGKGKGGLYDYWGTISDGNISLKGSKVFPWVDLNVTYNGDPKRDRTHQVQDCIDATEKYLADKHLTAKEYDLSDYYGLFILQNRPGGEFGSIQNVTIDGKNYSKGVVFFEFGSLDLSHAAHEMGHGYGLDHTFDLAQKKGCGGGGPGEYCDYWDPMGNPFWAIATSFSNPAFGTATCCGPKAQRSEQSSAGPGLNVRHLDELGWIPEGRINYYLFHSSRRNCSGSVTYDVAALSHPQAKGYLELRVPFDGPAKYYTVEFRHSSGWDRAFADSVLIHQVTPATNVPPGRSYIVDHHGSPPFLPGQTFTDTKAGIKIKVESFSGDTAKITISRTSGCR